MNEANIVIRDFNDDTDAGFVYSSWPKGAYYGAYIPITENRDKWFKNFYDYISQMIKHGSIKMACIADDPNTIIGFIVIYNKVLQWVYVKEMFRKQKIASLLIKNEVIDSVNMHNLTKIGESILTKKNKENLNGKEESRVSGSRDNELKVNSETV